MRAVRIGAPTNTTVDARWDWTFRALRKIEEASADTTVKVSSYTVSELPAASSANAGTLAFVTDANATTQNSIVASGGANKVLAISDGTDWRIA